MATVVVARDGDTLCTIAIAHGFANCDRVRAEAANAALLNRPLRAGDNVTVPDLEQVEENRGNEARHPFRRRGVPPPAIRFVHGSRDKEHRDDITLAHLNVSNYVVNQAGADGQQPFPNGFGFDEHADADEDAFKVEVVDPNADGNPVTIDLEAVREVRQPDGSVTWNAVGAPNANMRSIKVACESVEAGNRVRLRSRYMRLVTDEVDFAELSGNPPRADGTAQALLTTDTADGNNGDADALEILDQQVRATHTVVGCTASDPHKCKVVARVPIGPRRRRIKMAIHVFRRMDGGTAVGGASDATTERNIRLRTMKWFRRVYAQAELAPKLVAHQLRFVDPPSADMVSISNDSGVRATGASTMSFDVTLAPVGAWEIVFGAPAGSVSINLTAGMTPQQAAIAIAGAMPAGFSVSAASNAKAFSAADPAWDLLIRHTSGRRVIVRNEACTDTTMTITVSRPNMSAVDINAPDDNVIVGSLALRHLFRAYPGATDRLDVYVVERLNPDTTRGIANIIADDLPAGFSQVDPLRWGVTMAMQSTSGNVMDATDNLPFTYPHEAGHALNDAFHAGSADPLRRSELMTGTGTSVANAVGASKRICDKVAVQYEVFNPVQATTGDFHTPPISAVDRFRTVGNPVTEAW